MRRTALPAIIAGLILASTAIAPTRAAETKYFSWQGQWRISDEGTQYPAGFPTIKDHVTTVAKDDGKILQYTDSMTIAGQPFSSSYDGTFDGKPSKTSDGHMMWYKHVSANTYVDHWTDDKGTVGQDRCTFTPDGAHMNCTGSTTPKGGKKVSYKERWDKIQ